MRRNNMSEISSIHSVIPTTYTQRDVVTKVYQGDAPGETKVVSTYYNVTTYDYMGKLQTVTNSHVIDYLV